MGEQTLKPGWTWVKFGDVVRQAKDKVDVEASGLDRYIAGEHMDTDDLRIRRWGTIDNGYLGPAFHMRFRAGQVLYGSRRTYLRKVAVPDFEGICANTTFVLESKDETVLLSELLPFIMQTEPFHDHSIKQSKGSVNPYINFSDLAWYEFALPPLEEQRRIAKVLARAEQLVDASQIVLNSSKSLLEAATENFANKLGEKHSTVTVSQLVKEDKPITYGILKPGTGFPGGIPVIKVKDYPNGEVLTEDLLLTSPEIESEYKRSRLEAHDLLISIRGTVGRLAFVPPVLSGANITQDTARLSINNMFNRYYVRFMMESNFVQRQITSRITGMAVQGINIGELRKVEVPVVAIEKQQEIADQLLQIEQAITEAKERYDSTRTVLKKILVETI